MVRFVKFAVGAVLLSGVMVSAQQPAGEGPRVVGSVRDIMRQMVMPSSDVVFGAGAEEPKTDRKSTRLNSSHMSESRMPSSA